MALDDMRLRDLLEQSQDLHSDAMSRDAARRSTRCVEAGHDDRRNGDVVTPTRDRRERAIGSTLLGGLPKTGVLAAAGSGHGHGRVPREPGVRRQGDRRADAADRGVDREPRRRHLRHRAHARLHRRGRANAVVKAFVEKTKDQHEQHAKAFNAAATRLGGKAQTSPTPCCSAS